MKRLVGGVVGVVVAAALAVPAFAEQQESWHMEGEHLFVAAADMDKAMPKKGEKKYDPKESFEKFSKKLNLTDEQKEKIRPILNEKVQKVQEIKKDKSLPKDQKREKAMAIIEEYSAKVKEILNPEQQKKYDKMLQDKKKKMSEKKKQKGSEMKKDKGMEGKGMEGKEESK